VRSAELDLQDAREALAATILRAPFAGTIASVDGEVGQSVSGGSSGTTGAGGSGSGGSGSATGLGGATSTSAAGGSSSGFITLTNLDRLEMEVSVGESDIGDLEVGQAATVTVTALDDAQISGTVTRLGVLPSSTDGVVSYPVTLKLKQTADGIRPGMTASAEVVVDQATSAVSVPAQAVQGTGDRARVTIRRGDEDVVTTVTTGVVGDSSVQITTGLEAGDRVVLPALSTATAGGGTGMSAGGRGGGAPGGLGGGGFPAGGPPAGFGGGGFPGGGGGGRR